MADIAHKKTDKTIEELAKRFNEIYEQADNDLNDKLIAFYEKFAKDDAEMLAKLEAGEITKKRYTEWRYTKMLTGQRYFDLRDELAQDLVNVNSNARAMIAGEMADVYALNRNYAVFQVENSAHLKTSYVIYNKQAVENLLANDELRLPYPRTESPTAKLLRERIDLQWNRQKVNSALAQGILQGEPITKIAERLMTVTNMNHSSAVRNARTMMTATQNQARVDSYDELRDEGVELDEYWVATLDGFTRHSHRLLHGEMKDRETHTYSNGLEYPADPFGKPAEVYNCRCSEVAYPKGMKFEVPKSSPKLEEDFDKWQQGGTGHALWAEQKAQKQERNDFKWDLKDISNLEWFDIQRMLPKEALQEVWNEVVSNTAYPFSSREYFNAVISGKVKDEGIERLLQKHLTAEMVKEPNAYILRKGLKERGIEYRPLIKRETQKSFQQYLKDVAGGDETVGSCASLSFCFTAHIGGYEVRDFRGGESQSFFSQESNIECIAKLKNVTSWHERSYTERKTAMKMIKEHVDGKYYILSVGRHAAVITKDDTYGYLYLEQQSANEKYNGWCRLTNETLKSRFKATGSSKYNYAVNLIDVESLSKNSDFIDIMGYINTAEEYQQKGVYGHEK